MSQDELAEKLEVTRQSISLWETGQTQPSLDNIIALAKLFNISTDDLLTESSTKASGPNPKPPHNKSSNKKAVVLIVAIVAAVALLILAFALISNRNSDIENNVDEGSDVQVIDTEATDTVNESIDETSGVEDENKTTHATVEVVTEEVTEETTEETIVTEEVESALSTVEVETEVSDNSIDETVEVVTEEQIPDEKNMDDLYGYLKSFVVDNGVLNGDYCYYSKSADNYGGYSSERFSLYYWGDTDTVEFCLHSVLDDTYSINFYLYIPKTYTGNYEYKTSYYFRDTGEPLYEARGIIEADKFTKKYPLICTEYFGSTDVQNEFMEMSRQGMCDLLDCLREFTSVENLEYSFSDLGFDKFE